MSKNIALCTDHQESFPAKLQEWALKWWLTFAQTLNVSEETINRLRLNMAVGLSLQGAIDEILTDWIRRGMSEEEMNKLEQDEDKTVFNTSVFQRLTIDFCKCQDLSWNALNKAVKGRVLTKPVYFCGETTTLLGIRQYLPSPEYFDELLGTSINASLIQEFMNDSCMVLTKQVKYYSCSYFLPRTILVQTYLCPSVFSKLNENDVFIVKNIEWSDLQFHANHGLVIRSTNLEQLDTASCIALESDDHLGKIKKYVLNKNIHVISYEDSIGKGFRFIWEKTIGEGAVMLKHVISQSRATFSELNFMKLHYSEKGTSTMCLYGVSGIGKTTFLKSVYSRLLQEYKDRISIFYGANQLLQDVCEIMKYAKETEITREIIVKCVSKNYSRNAIGESLLRKLLLSKYIFTELFIDSLDDIPPARFHDFIVVVRAIEKSKYSRVTIACAPRMMKMLSEHISMIQCELLSFNTEEQLQMFQCYCAKEPENRGSKTLVQFSRKCCTKLVNNTSYHIVGIPLQIRLVGEIYQRKADEIISGSIQAVHILPTPVDIYKLFKNIINKTLNSDRPAILRQAYKCLTEYFPDLTCGKKPPTDCEQDVPVDIEKKDEGLLEHRISKQYFVATYLSQYMQEIPETKETSILFESILDRIFDMYQTKKINRTYSFVRFFLDKMCIELKRPPSSNFRRYLANKSSSSNIVEELATNGLFGLVYLIISSGNVGYSFSNLTVPEYTKLVLTATRSGNKQVVEFICSQSMFTLEIFNNEHISAEWKMYDITMTPLHIAIRRGCLTLFHFFLEKYGDLVCTMKGLIHAAVEKTYDLQAEAIVNKIQIIKYLIQQMVTDYRSDTAIVNEKIGDGHTPLLMNRVHIDLISLLIRYGADPGVRESRSHNTVAHILPSYCSTSDFKTFLGDLSQIDHCKVILQRNADYETAYKIATRKLKLTTDVVDRIAY